MFGRRQFLSGARGRRDGPVTLSAKWGPCWLTGHDPMPFTLRVDKRQRGTFYECAKCCREVPAKINLHSAAAPAEAPVLVFKFNPVED